MRFEFLDEYLKQQTERAEELKKFVEREQKAKAELDALKHEYEETIANSVKSGAKAEDKLDELSSKIEEATKNLERRREERRIFSTLPKSGITPDDVQQKFFNEYRQEYKEKVIKPITDKLAKLKSDYYRAVFEYIDAIDRFKAEKRAVIDTIGTRYQYKLGDVDVDRFAKRKSFFGDDDLYYMYRRQLPNNYHLMEDEENE
jgi:chromosome segregation ATPase